MPAVVDRETVGELTDFDELAGSFEQGYTYKGREPGEEILEHPDIPPLDHVVIIRDVKFYAVGYDVEQYFEATTDSLSSGRVVVKYDTLAGSGAFAEAEYIAWEKSYQKEMKRVPSYVLQSRFYDKPGGVRAQRWDWVEQGLAVPVKYSTLNVTVNWIAGNLQTRNQILPIIAAIDAQEDHLHIIQQFGTKKWVMQPAQVRQADRTRVEISYAWISDPGNGPIGLPGSLGEEERNYIIVPNIQRPPFFEYQIIPQREILDDPQSQTASTNPTIIAVDLYPQQFDDGSPNPRYDPLGYKSLPGNPLQ